MTLAALWSRSRARHSVSLLHAHLVFVTKYRRRVFTDAMLTYCENTQRVQRPQCRVGRVQPTLAVWQLVQRLKGRTAYAVRREYTGACVRARMRGHPWSPCYFALSCAGAPPSIIKQYIDGQ